MPKLCRVDIKESKKVLEDLKELAKELKDRFGCEVYLFGSFAKGEVHEGSDIDLIIVGDFKERFFERIGIILEMTELPVEPLVYTREEFEAMKKENPFIREVLKGAKRLA
ncbi:nucleotidyltransferase domain-containing protein [Methanosarcinales archaeon]|nr:nucleotidyltransferase domain-containing protein [Candidatus Syntrophoarchaeum sp.]RLG31878.1 MAG: nucleotidyltransferase domain-containing protein [Methanosarcinales archaeon]